MAGQYAGQSLYSGTQTVNTVTVNQPVGGQTPAMVTQANANGIPTAFVPMPNIGFNDTDPTQAPNLINPANNPSSNIAFAANPDDRMKAAFSDFLKLRHGGSGFLFAFGTGDSRRVCNASPPAASSAIPADRPFRSLSYPDINYTVMRPASLPPSPSDVLSLLPRQPAVRHPTAGGWTLTGNPWTRTWGTPMPIPCST